MSAQTDDARQRAVAEPQHQQRRQGDHGHGLRDHDERREHRVEQARVRRGGGEGERHRRAERQAGRRPRPSVTSALRRKSPGSAASSREHGRRRREHERRHVRDAHDELARPA